MILAIRNMKGTACIMYVKNVFKKLHLHYISIELGKIETIEDLDDKTLYKLNALLKEGELEIIDNKEITIVKQIKLIIFNLIQNNRSLHNTLSVLISKKLNKKYRYLSKIFTIQCGININEYIKQVKVEKIKEYLKEDKLKISEISTKMHFSSSSQLSHIFKKTTNITPTQFKKLYFNKK